MSRVFNNADSFASAFDDAWREHSLNQDLKEKSPEEKLIEVLELIKEHPLMKESPSQAKDIALFRIRLLNLT